jgi:hypothetical protein
MLARTASPAPRFGSRRPALKSVHRTDLTGYAVAPDPFTRSKHLARNQQNGFAALFCSLGSVRFWNPKRTWVAPGSWPALPMRQESGCRSDDRMDNGHAGKGLAPCRNRLCKRSKQTWTL